MKRNMAETILGAVVIAVAVFFLIFSYKTADLTPAQGYEVTADFAGTGGLKAGDDVVISGVKIGSVEKITLVPDTYLARVHIGIASNIKLPEDTAALISSQSLLGGRYLALEPGAADEIIPPGGRVQYTQAPQNLEQLLGQFIFTMQDDKKDKKGGDETATPAAAPAAAVSAPKTQIPEAPKPVPAPMPEKTPDAPAAAAAPTISAPAESTPADAPPSQANDPNAAVHP